MNDSAKTFVSLAQSKIQLLGQKFNYDGGFYLQSPSASPMLMGVGFIIGPNISAVLFAGAVMGWMFLVPAGVLLNSGIEGVAHLGSWVDLAEDVWYRQIRPLAVGTMIVAAFIRFTICVQLCLPVFPRPWEI